MEAMKCTTPVKEKNERALASNVEQFSTNFKKARRFVKRLQMSDERDGVKQIEKIRENAMHDARVLEGDEVEGDDAAEEEEGEDNDNSDGESENCQSADNSGINFRIDPEVLNCPLCRKPLQPPIFQCINGHFACSRCCKKLHNDCPVCARTIGSIRCLPLEFVIGSIKIFCPYARFGCKEVIIYTRKKAHKKACPYAPCFCPIPDCMFKGPAPMLSSHLLSEHRSFPPQICFNYGCSFSFRVSLQRKQLFYILRARDGRMLLLINNRLCSGCGASWGNALSVVFIGPGNAARDLHYELEVEGG